MLSFRALLESSGVDPRTVKLVRHRGRNGRRTTWGIWRADPEAFELYQRIQKNPIYGEAESAASFVAAPDGRTLFVGLYRVAGLGRAPAGLTCPINDWCVAGLNLYDLKRAEMLADYAGRLVIDWGPGHRSWHQRADRHDKPIVELAASETIDPPFPGPLDFRAPLSALEALPRGWCEVLGNLRGVYLMVHPETGAQYVGAATGETGFLGRWRDYAANGHGGNELMIACGPADYEANILEVAGSEASVEDILRREAIWKEKLGTRAHGLNAN